MNGLDFDFESEEQKKKIMDFWVGSLASTRLKNKNIKIDLMPLTFSYNDNLNGNLFKWQFMRYFRKKVDGELS